MRTRSFATWGVMATVALAMLAPAPAAGQARSAGGRATGAQAWTAPRTPDGHPDLQGVWDYRTITTMQRADRFLDKQFLTEEEAAALEQEKLNSDNAPPARPETFRWGISDRRTDGRCGNRRAVGGELLVR